ncbi:hypothetical protein PI124_g14328 [Phytophthora idaei]|nr:hypothetical protein PI124_g14328 [Phytophthora idaei]
MSKRGDIPLGASEPLPAVPGLFVDGLPLITTCMPRWVKTPRVFKFYTSRTFMDDIGARLGAEIDKYYLRKDLSAKSCRLICEMLVDASDPELVKVFFTEIGINVFLLKPPIPVFSPPLNKLKG